MKLLINIGKNEYDLIRHLKVVYVARGNCKTIQQSIINAIKQGMPLPDTYPIPNDVVYAPELYTGCLGCNAHSHCPDAFHSNAVHCGAYGGNVN